MIFPEILQHIVRFIYNLIFSLLNPIIEVVRGTLPLFNTGVYYFNELIDMIIPYIRFICDALFINNTMLAITGAVIMWAVSTKLLIYAIKLVARWWETII